jgi:hypothetical protein
MGASPFIKQPKGGLAQADLPGALIIFLVIPSKDLSHQGHHDGAWPHIRRVEILEYRDAWGAFGDIG